ncbi:unnamed protein product [Cuscuta epithymum]|nr:unnamed protein product [Cuscuta epithymum]
MDAWSPMGKGHGRSVGLEAGTDLDSRSSVLGGDIGSLIKNMINKRQGEEEATVLLDRPPLDPPLWSAEETRVWKHLFNFTLCLRFIFQDQTVYFSVGYF